MYSDICAENNVDLLSQLQNKVFMTLNAAMEETLTKTTRLSTKLVVLHFHQKIRSMFIYLARFKSFFAYFSS